MKSLPKFIVVVHATNESQAVAQSQLALECGAGGVFLISHQKLKWSDLNDVYNQVRKLHPDSWIGLNYLDLPVLPALTVMPETIDGLWCDTIRLPSNIIHDLPDMSPGGPALFAGAAFKYQDTGMPPGEDAVEIAQHCAVVTTSGPSTGNAPSMDKLHEMRAAMNKKKNAGTKKLAVASGVNMCNIRGILGIADCVMVNTSISLNHRHLDPEAVTKMAKRVAEDCS